MKRILVLIKGLGPGGAEQLLVNASRYFDTSRFEYHVAYILPWKDHLVPTFDALSIPIHLLGGSATPWPLALRWAIERNQIHLVHTHSPALAAAARAVARSKKVPVVHTEHMEWSRYHPATCWANALTFPMNDRVFAVSNEVLGSFRYPFPFRFMSLPPAETLYHGIDPNRVPEWTTQAVTRAELGLTGEGPVIGTIAHFRKQKGHEVLIRALPRVLEGFPNLQVVLVGHGPLEERIRGLVEKAGLRSSVHFLGGRPDAQRFLSLLDVFVLPSLYEGLPIALVEALAMGRPVVVTDVSGTREVVQDGVQGRVVAPNDPEALATALTDLLGDADARRRFASAAVVRAQRFRIDAAVKRYEEVYTELV